MENFEMILSAAFIYSVIRLTTPIIFATLSAIISSKCGVTNIATEGMMLTTALSSAIISAKTQSVAMALCSAALIGALIGGLFILVTDKLKSNPVITGLSFNTIASGGTVFALWLFTGDKGASTSLNSLKAPQIEIPLLKEIPILGEILSNHNVLTYLAFVCVLLMSILLYKTSLGLRIRAVGENEEAAKSVGIHTTRIKVISLLISGAMSGLGGAFMSMGYLSWFSTNMVAGRGFIGLAAEAMGGGMPGGGLFMSLLFGFADALSNTLQTMVSIPAELIQMIPYLSTIAGLALISWLTRRKIQKRKMSGKYV